MSGEIPLCKCHEVEMLWKRDPRYRARGYWRCRIKHSMDSRRRYAQDPIAQLWQQWTYRHRRRLAALESRLNGGG